MGDNMKFEIEGSDSLPSGSGGYLYISLDGHEVATVSVPSPAYEDRYRDSVVENGDDFEDYEGNHYSVNVFSSNVGVDWTISVSTEQNDSDVKDRIQVEYQANEY